MQVQEEAGGVGDMEVVVECLDDIIMVGVKELGGSVWWTLLRNKMCVLWASLVLIYLQCKLVFGGCDDKIVLCFVELG